MNALPLHLFDFMTSSFAATLQAMPLVLLQATTLVGIIAVMLILTGNTPKPSEDSWGLGLMLGLANFLIIMIVQHYLNIKINLYLFIDSIFIAAFFGGWRNALSVGFFCLLARAMFGGEAAFSNFILDMTSISLGSLLLRRLLINYNITQISLREIGSLIIFRFMIVEVPPLFALFFDFEHVREILQVLFMRFFTSFSVSILLVYAVCKLTQLEFRKINMLFFDQVSQLPNRRSLQRDLENDCARFKEVDGTPVKSLMLVDITNFQELIQVNGYDWTETFFRHLGNELSTYKESVLLHPYYPVFYAFTPHSFAIALDGITMPELQRGEIAQNLHSELMLCARDSSGKLEPRITVSAIDLSFEQGVAPARLLDGLGMLERQRIGAVHYLEADFAAQVAMEEHLRLQIERWIVNGEVPLNLQPKVMLRNQQCVGAEGLLRIKNEHCLGQFVNPHLILSIAVKYYLLDELEWAIIRRTVDYLARMPKELEHLKIAVNLSPLSLTKADFGKKLRALLIRENVASERLVVEIIETSQLPNMEIVRENIMELSSHGIQLSLDDFGSAYSSISLLAHYPFNELKLDHSMISNLSQQRMREAVAMSIDGAKRYQARVVAEGIESVLQKETLLKMGVTCGQGYLFAKALSFEDFVSYAQAGVTPA